MTPSKVKVRCAARPFRAVLIGLLASLACAAPASAFTPPEIYVRLTHANSIDHTPVSDWMPLAAAPQLNWLGGYEIGYAFQDAPGSGHSQRAALEITGVPDGQTTQPLNSPYCSGGPGTVGAIVPVGTALQFEGSGTYSVRVSVGPPSGDQDDCMSGPGTASSTGSFGADAPVAPEIAGTPLIFRAAPLAANTFAGVAGTPPPPGGEADVRCAANATVQADGSVAGQPAVPAASEDGPRARIAEDRFPRPAAWTCVARGSVEGIDDNLDTMVFGTPWSAPVTLDVRTDFRRSRGQISRPASKTPLLRFTAEFTESAGGTGKLELKRFIRCKKGRHVLKSVGAYKGRLDSKGRTTIKVRRPRRGAYTGTLSFSGTRFVKKSADPNPVFLEVTDKNRLLFVPRDAFPHC